MFTDYDIEALKKKYRLPKGQKDLVVNRDHISEFFQVSVVTIDKWQKGGMPLQTKGGNGKSYEFSVHDCFAWFKGWKNTEAEADKARSAELNQMRLELLGSDANEEMVALTPAEQKKVYEAAKHYVEAALLKRDLVKAAEVTMMLEGVLSILRNEVLALPDVLERQVGLTPEQAEATVKFSKELVNTLYENLNTSNLVIELAAKKKAVK